MAQKSKKLRIGITHGDINGISYELLLKTFAKKGFCELFTPIVYGSSTALRFWAKHFEINELNYWNIIDSLDEVKENVVNLLSCCPEENVEVHIGKGDTSSGEFAFLALEKAMEHSLNGDISALVTAPINKSVMPQKKFPYNGHTDYLGAKCGLSGDETPLMILTSGAIRVALVTTHIPINKVAENISEEKIISKLKALEQSLKRDFNIEKPRIAVLGLNPHCSDNGLMGDEEKQIITPAIKKALDEENILSFGPFPSDGFWGSEGLYQYDGILALYHDQGLSPFKALFMNNGVNFSAGLPIVRTSPDHGTGFDLAGKGKASEESLYQAIYLAIDTVRRREMYDEARKNPLPTLYNTRGQDN